MLQLFRIRKYFKIAKLIQKSWQYIVVDCEFVDFAWCRLTERANWMLECGGG